MSQMIHVSQIIDAFQKVFVFPFPQETTDAALAALVAQRGQMAARMPSLATDPEPLELRCGNPAGVIAARRRTAQAANGGGTLTGKLHTGAQKHFYMEPHVTLASPQVRAPLPTTSHASVSGNVLHQPMISIVDGNRRNEELKLQHALVNWESKASQ